MKIFFSYTNFEKLNSKESVKAKLILNNPTIRKTVL